MLSPPRVAPAPGASQTVRSLRVLLVLCVACVLFVAVALLVAAPLEPPVEAQIPTTPPALEATMPGG
jgi:hypothetical protein